MGNPPKKKSEKKIFNRRFPCDSLSHGKLPATFLPMGNPTTRKNFSYGKYPAFFTNPLWEIPTKNLKKNFFFGIYGQLFPQKWGCPLGRGGTGGYLPPPMGYMGGG